MSDQFLAEIRMFGCNYAPLGWAFCNGQLLPISQQTALFSLLGSNYGGNGQTTFALPGMQANVPISQGTGAGLTPRVVGETGGVLAVNLLATEIPTHTHDLMADALDAADLNVPKATEVLAQSAGVFAYQPASTGITPMSAEALPPAGGSLPHTNIQPFLVLNFCIALQGVFPQRP